MGILTSSLSSAVARPLQIPRLERLFGAMHQHSQIIARQPQLGAHLILVPLLQQHGLQQVTVALGQLAKDSANLLFRLIDRE